MPDSTSSPQVSNVAAGLFASASTTVNTNTTNNVATTPTLGVQGAGTTNLGSDAYNSSFADSANNTITINAASAPALALAGDAVSQTLAQAGATEALVIGSAKQETQSAQELAKSATATASQQFLDLLKPILIAAAVIFGLFVIFSGGKRSEA